MSLPSDIFDLPDLLTWASGGAYSLDDFRSKEVYGFCSQQDMSQIRTSMFNNFYPFDDQRDFEHFQTTIRMLLFVGLACLFGLEVIVKMIMMCLPMNGNRGFCCCRKRNKNDNVEKFIGKIPTLNIPDKMVKFLTRTLPTIITKKGTIDFQLANGIKFEHFLHRCLGLARIGLSVAIFTFMHTASDNHDALYKDRMLGQLLMSFVCAALFMQGWIRILITYDAHRDSNIAFYMRKSDRPEVEKTVASPSDSILHQMQSGLFLIIIFSEWILLSSMNNKGDTEHFKLLRFVGSLLLGGTMCHHVWWRVVSRWMTGDVSLTNTESVNKVVLAQNGIQSNDLDRSLTIGASIMTNLFGLAGAILLSIPTNDLEFAYTFLRVPDQWYFPILVLCLVGLSIDVLYLTITTLWLWIEKCTSGKGKKSRKRKKTRDDSKGKTQRKYMSSSSDEGDESDSISESESESDDTDENAVSSSNSDFTDSDSDESDYESEF